MPEKIENVPEISKRNKTNTRLVCPNLHNKDVLVSEVISENVDELFRMTTTDMYCLKKNNLFEMYNTTTIVIGDWVMNNKTKCEHLTISYTGKMNYPFAGLKEVNVKEDMKLLPCSKKGHLYVMDSSYEISGISSPFNINPYKHVCLRRVAENKTEVTVIIGLPFVDQVRNVGQTHPTVRIWDKVKQKINKGWTRTYFEAKRNEEAGKPAELFSDQLQKDIAAIIKGVESIPVVQNTMKSVQILNNTHKYGQYFLVGLIVCSASYLLVTWCPLSIFK